MVDGGDTANGLLMAEVDGGWGNLPRSGTWPINPTLWTMHGSAANSIHVGGGRGGDSGVMFLINQGATSGTWSGTQADGINGGGLSNIKLWGSREGSTTEVPEPATLALLGLGLLGAWPSRVGAASSKRRQSLRIRPCGRMPQGLILGPLYMGLSGLKLHNPARPNRSGGGAAGKLGA